MSIAYTPLRTLLTEADPEWEEASYDSGTARVIDLIFSVF